LRTQKMRAKSEKEVVKAAKNKKSGEEMKEE
jgi:hypothetical protein